MAFGEGPRLFECARCEFRFFPPSDQPPEELYGEHYFVGAHSEYLNYIADETAHRRQARRYLDRIEAVQGTGKNVLDVGCAAGFFLDEARSRGWNAVGLDVSAYAADHARNHLRLPVTVGAFPWTWPPNQTFDVVTFFNVFEHLAAPRLAVERLTALVRPGGLVAIETWDWKSSVARAWGLGWHQYDARHVPCYYSKCAIGLAFPAGDWELVRYSVATKWISVRRAAEVLAKRSSVEWFTRLLAGRVGNALGRLDVPYRLGDLVWVVLRRRSGSE